MSVPIADSVLAATHKLVQQAMTGQWQDVAKTQAERRALLDQLSAGAAQADQPWLSALKQAMAESDAAVARIQAATAMEQRDSGLEIRDSVGIREPGIGRLGSGGAVEPTSDGLADAMMDMIRRSK